VFLPAEDMLQPFLEGLEGAFDAAFQPIVEAAGDLD